MGSLLLCSQASLPLLTKMWMAQEKFLDGQGSGPSAVVARQERTKEAKLQRDFHAVSLKHPRHNLYLIVGI